MSKTFPTNPYDLINAIEQDAPAVYEILMEEYHPTVDDRYPSREELTTILENYSGNNYDVHYWFGRWSILKELINPDAHKGDNSTLHIAELMNDLTRIHYGYMLLRCDKCDAVHRLHNSDEFNTILGVCGGDGFDVEYGFKCSCGQDGDQDSPDLFY